jgi:hypothetical protein
MAAGKYLLVKGTAGLGNRLLSMLAALLYGRLSGRTLVMDWKGWASADDPTEPFHRLFQSPWVDPSVELPQTDSICPSVWRGRLHLSTHQLAQQLAQAAPADDQPPTSVDLTRLDHPEAVAVMWSYFDHVDLFQRHFPAELRVLGLGESRDEILRTLLRRDLLLHPALRARVNRFRDDHFSGSTVGVHVRYSDHRVSLLRLLRPLDALLAREPGLQIFLATDNAQVVRVFQDAYPSVVTLPHWYPEPGRQIHFGTLCPDRFAAMVDAVTDLYLLAECQYLVIDTSSTFSEIARLLSDAPPANVFNAFARDKMHARYRIPIWKLWLHLGLFKWGLWTVGKWVKYRRRVARWARVPR